MTSLVAEAFDWGRPADHTGGIVQVSTVFGDEPKYWTLAIPGSDQHHMVTDFEIIASVRPPGEHSLRHAAEQIARYRCRAKHFDLGLRVPASPWYGPGSCYPS